MISRTTYSILISFRLPGHERGCTVAGLWFPSSLAVLRSPNVSFEVHSAAAIPSESVGKGVAPQWPDLHARCADTLHYLRIGFDLNGCLPSWAVKMFGWRSTCRVVEILLYRVVQDSAHPLGIT